MATTPATTPTINAAVDFRDQLARFPNVTVSGQILTTDTGTLHLVVPRNAQHQVFVRRIIINVGNIGTTITIKFQGSDTNSQPVFTPPQLAAVGPQDIEFGEIGLALVAGATLDLVLSAAGAGFSFVAECYIALIPQVGGGVLTPAQAIP